MRHLLTSFIFLVFCVIVGPAMAAGPVFTITDFGAKPDGKTLNTKAIQAAIDKAAAVQGTVYVPTGTFLTGTIFLKTGVTLELGAGGVILGSPNIKDYTAMTWGHHEDRTPWHLIAAKGATNVTICGRGTIDGNGKAFWNKERRHEWDFYKEEEMRPSPMVELEECTNVLVKDVTIQNSAGWGLHPFNSTNVKVDNATVLNDPFGPNSDGIDVTGCQDVLIANCRILVGDDAIALKTTEDSRECTDVVVTNCVLSSSCVAIRIGYESRKDFRRITVTNCTVKRASRFVDIRSIEGAIIEHVLITNVVGEDNSGWPLNRLIEIDLNKVDSPYSVEIPEHPNYHKPKPVEKIGAIRYITISNIDARSDSRIMISSVPGGEISNINLSNIRIRYAMLDDPGPLAAKAKTHGFFRETPEVRTAQAALVFKNISNLMVSNVQIMWPQYPVPQDWNLLKTEWRKLNPTLYVGKEEDVRSGKSRPTWSAIWAEDINGGVVDLTGLTASDASKPVIQQKNTTWTVRK